MLRIITVLKNKKGSASVMWLAFLPVMLLMLFFLANLATAGMTHASTNKAAEAGALAAINKLDHWLLDEVEDEIEYPDGVSVGNLSIKEKLEYADQGELALLANQFVSERGDQLAAAVRNYVESNGGDAQGTVRFPVHQKHIQVKSRSLYEPFAFKSLFTGTYIDGKGLSPSRSYLSSLSHREINY